MKLINSKSKKEIKIGDKAKTFRGEKVVVIGMTPPRHSGSTGRVYVQTGDMRREFFPSVCNMEWVAA